MRNKFIISIIFTILVINSSCHRNRLKTNEKGLVQEILLQEKTQAEKDAIMRKSADSLKRFTGAFKLKEERKTDSKSPPVAIDIAGNLNNVKELKLTDIASSVSYVRMKPIPDTTIPRNLKFKYFLMDNYIVAINLYGIHLYSKEGRYLRSIVKNEMTGVIVEPDQLIFWMDYTMKGGGYSVQSVGDNLYYSYSNNITGQKYIMKYDCSTLQMKPGYRYNPENPDQISGLGEIALDLNHGNTVAPPPRRHQGMFSGSSEGFFKNMGAFILDKDSYILPASGDNMLVVLNNQGDTLSEFTRLERLVNYTKSLQRGTDGGTNYESGGMFFYRPAFNDTVFRIDPPNRLTPVYVLKLGEYKVSRQEGVDPGFDLTGKMIPEEWAETPEIIFLTFTKDDYDCPNTRKNKTVKIYHAIYSKSDRIFSIIKGDPFNYQPEILENNIDGGVPVWPLSYMTGRSGEILIPLKGSELKARIKTSEFINSEAPENKKQELKKLADSASESEDILMIIK